MSVLEFSVDKVSKFIDDEDVELSIAKVDFFSNRPNSHKVNITEEMLRRDAPSILGKFIVAKMNMFGTDAEGHEADEVIMGYAPKDQEIQYHKTVDGYLVASCEFVISKLYASDFYEMFKVKNHKSVSVEMTYTGRVENEDGTIDIDGFNLTGVTVLGDKVRPACADACVEIIRFSETIADEFYHKQHESVKSLQKFANSRRQKMADTKSYKINKTDLKDVDWGSVDKSELRDKVMGAKNRNTLVKSVYAIVEEGWEDAPSEHLKYPLMAEIDGVFYYVREALSSALAYAKQHNENEVISKVEKLYKKFNIGDSEQKGGEDKMSEQVVEIVEEMETQEFEEKVEDVIECAEEEKVEEVEKKEMSETEQEVEVVEQQEEQVEEEPDYKAMCDAKQVELNEMIAKYQEQCDVVMAQNAELETLRKFKADVEEEQRKNIVASTLAKIKGRVDEALYAEFAESGENCTIESVNTWKTNLFAKVGENVISFSEKSNEDVMRMELPKVEKKSESVWDRL